MGRRCNHQKEALEQAQRLNILGEMASGFAHELNQPLSAIKSYAQGSGWKPSACRGRMWMQSLSLW